MGIKYDCDLIKSRHSVMMKSEQDETALIDATNRTIVSKALCIVVGSAFVLGVGVGLAIYHFFIT
jgi:hypothetical protein